MQSCLGALDVDSTETLQLVQQVVVRNLLTESAIQQVDHEAFGSALAGICD
jgi:hypothetical protein